MLEDVVGPLFYSITSSASTPSRAGISTPRVRAVLPKKRKPAPCKNPGTEIFCEGGRSGDWQKCHARLCDFRQLATARRRNGAPSFSRTLVCGRALAKKLSNINWFCPVSALIPINVDAGQPSARPGLLRGTVGLRTDSTGQRVHHAVAEAGGLQLFLTTGLGQTPAMVRWPGSAFVGNEDEADGTSARFAQETAWLLGYDAARVLQPTPVPTPIRLAGSESATGSGAGRSAALASLVAVAAGCWATRASRALRIVTVRTLALRYRNLRLIEPRYRLRAEQRIEATVKPLIE